MTLPDLPRRSGDLLFGGHVVLALAMGFWRTFESIPGWSVRDGGSFTTSTPGRLLALGTLLVGGLAGLAVVLQTGRRWRDPRALLLAALLVLALSLRREVDLFDLVYAGFAIAFGVWWWKIERAPVQERA